MRLLLDTHVALWAIAADPRLPKAAMDLLLDPDNEIVVSAASIWEITIKHALAKGRPDDVPISGQQALDYFREAGYSMLGIGAEHAAAVGRLPLLHRDPFDRMLIAQALHEPMRLVTHDAVVASYDGSIVLV